MGVLIINSAVLVEGVVVVVVSVVVSVVVISEQLFQVFYKGSMGSGSKKVILNAPKLVTRTTSLAF